MPKKVEVFTDDHIELDDDGDELGYCAHVYVDDDHVGTLWSHGLGSSWRPDDKLESFVGGPFEGSLTEIKRDLAEL